MIQDVSTTTQWVVMMSAGHTLTKLGGREHTTAILQRPTADDKLRIDGYMNWSPVTLTPDQFILLM
jgi:hypothetical protein